MEENTMPKQMYVHLVELKALWMLSHWDKLNIEGQLIDMADLQWCTLIVLQQEDKKLSVLHYCVLLMCVVHIFFATSTT